MATINKRGPAYYLTYSKDGVQVRRSLGKIGRKEAEAVLAQKEAELAGLIVPRSGRTVRMVLQGYLDWTKTARKSSHKGIKYALLPLINKLGDHPAESVDVSLIERWTEQQTNAASTVSKSLRMARAAYRRGIRLRFVADNPFERASLPKVVEDRAPPWYTKDELEALYAAPRGALWRFMVNTGVRRGEMYKALRRDVRNGILQIESTATGRTKSGKWRWVPLNAAAVDALASLGEDRLVTCQHVDTLTDWFGEDLAAINKERTKDRKHLLEGSPHWLRHTFCTHLAQAGVSLHEIKRLAGHSSIAVTEKYAHHLPDAGRAAIDKLDL
jgi:integrase